MIIVKDENGKEYSLEFTRRTVEQMQSNGFVLDLDKPNLVIRDLFYGALQAHHKRIDREQARQIWLAQSNKEQLLTVLVKAYQKPLEDLMVEPEDADPENPTWKEV